MRWCWSRSSRTSRPSTAACRLRDVPRVRPTAIRSVGLDVLVQVPPSRSFGERGGEADDGSRPRRDREPEPERFLRSSSAPSLSRTRRRSAVSLTSSAPCPVHRGHPAALERPGRLRRDGRRDGGGPGRVRSSPRLSPRSWVGRPGRARAPATSGLMPTSKTAGMSCIRSPASVPRGSSSTLPRSPARRSTSSRPSSPVSRGRVPRGSSVSSVIRAAWDFRRMDYGFASSVRRSPAAPVSLVAHITDERAPGLAAWSAAVGHERLREPDPVVLRRPSALIDNPERVPESRVDAARPAVCSRGARSRSVGLVCCQPRLVGGGRGSGRAVRADGDAAPGRGCAHRPSRAQLVRLSLIYALMDGSRVDVRHLESAWRSGATAGGRRSTSSSAPARGHRRRPDRGPPSTP